MKTFFNGAVVWCVVSILLLAACTFLPLRIRDDGVRNFVMRWVLVPVSIVIIIYVYPVGIEIFQKLALNFSF